MKLRLSDRALRDLARIHDYSLLMGGQDLADRVADRLFETVALLEQHPRLGRESQLRRRRELVIDDYIAIYSLHRDEIVVRTIVHGARKRNGD